MSLVLIAITAHVWLGRSPQTLLPANGNDVRMPGARNPVVRDLSVIGDPGRTSREPRAGAASSAAAPAVTVLTELVPVPMVGGESSAPSARLPRERTEPGTTGTSGILPASLSAAATGSAAPTAEAAERAESNGVVESAAREPNEPADASLQLTPLAASRRVPVNIPAAAIPVADRPVASGRVIHATPIVEPDQKDLVLRVLEEYAAAYGRLDVDATKAVYPTVNYAALRRAFSQLETQRVTLGACNVSISGSDANARCKGEASYRPRVGPRTLHSATREWTFNLSKADAAWQIVKATVR